MIPQLVDLKSSLKRVKMLAGSLPGFWLKPLIFEKSFANLAATLRVLKCFLRRCCRVILESSVSHYCAVVEVRNTASIMSHEAYEASPILENLPLVIESIACFKDKLLVGTKNGHLLVYTVTSTPRSNELRYEVALDSALKSFAKKSITQLAAVPELYVLISLSDSQVSVHDLTGLQMITTLAKSKGATLFAVTIEEEKSLTGEVQHSLKLCVVVKRKLQLYYWRNRDFHELKADMSVPDVPRALAWCGDSLCIGFKRDYFLIRIEDGNQKHLCPTGKSLEPFVMDYVHDNSQLALGLDENTIFIDAEGKTSQKHALRWNDVPLVMAHDQPYIIGVLPKHVEVRTIDPRILIQSIELSQPRFITQCKKFNYIYVASGNSVWRLTGRPITLQIEQLLASKEFKLALRLARMKDDDSTDQKKQIAHIETLHAFDMFCQKKFEESMKIFQTLDIDPAHVIGLFPELLPHEYRKQLRYPGPLPDIVGNDLENGLLALIEYLTEKRNGLIKNMNIKTLNPSPIMEGATVIKSRKQLSMIIDTTLLKCYLNTNEALVAPLLRLGDNNCHVSESERVLIQRQRYGDLIILYERKGLHKKALDMLIKQSQKPGSPLRGHDRTVLYLQHLGPEHMDLIFEYAEWVLRAEPEDGLNIFTEDLPEVESLPRDKVLAYLEGTVASLAIPYLEHVITYWNDKTEEFHNRLVVLYREKIQRSPKPEDRQKLLDFLQTSVSYNPAKLLTHFPYDDFFEERAILFGRLQRHELALAIYIHILQKPDLAESYCKRTFDVHKDKTVYSCLLKMYLKPPDLQSSLGIELPQGIKVEPNIEAALTLLSTHSQHIDTGKALELLPNHLPMDRVMDFLDKVLNEHVSSKRSTQILKSLLKSEHLQVQEERIYSQRVKCVLTEEKMCRICKKRVGNSAFARYPNGTIVHYYCCKDPKAPPPI